MYTMLMIVTIVVHVVIALASLVVASYVALRPSVRKLAASYGLIIATVATGTYLLVTSSRPILSSCLMGLVYLTAVTLMTIRTHIKLKQAEYSE